MLGVDLSDLSVKMVDTKKKGSGIELSCFVNSQLPEHALQQGEIKNTDLVAKTIRQAAKTCHGSKSSGKYIIASLPEIKAFLRIIKIPNTTQENLNKALKLEIEQHIPYKLDEVYLDSQITKQDEKSSEIIVAAVPKTVVDKYLEAFDKAKLVPVALEIESIATARSLIKNSLKDNNQEPNALIIDLGSKYTNFIVYDQGTVRFSKTVKIASFNLTDALSKALKINFAKAEQMKRKWGLDLKAKDGKIFATLKPLIEELVEEIGRIINFYEDRHLGTQLSRVMLTGGSSNLKGLDAYLSLRLSRNIAIGDPWVNFKTKKNSKFIPPIPKNKSLNFSTAIGLSLRGLNFDLKDIN